MLGKLITVRVCFKDYDKFLLQTRYFYKEMQVQNYLPMEEVYGVVITRYPKFVYFEWKGQAIKNTSNVKK